MSAEPRPLSVRGAPPEELLPEPQGRLERLWWRLRRSPELAGLRLALWRVLFGAALLVLWQIASGRWVSEKLISSPGELATVFAEWVRSGSIFFHFAYTLTNTLYGYVAGSLLGIGLGFALAGAPVIAAIIEPYIMAFNGVPRIAYGPLFIAWFGIERLPKVVLVGTIVFFLTFVSTFSGIRGVPQDLINVARVMGGRRFDVYRKIILPSAMPWIINGLKVSVPFGMVGAIVGEYLVSDRGLGYLLSLYSNEYYITGMILVILLLMVVVLLVNQGLNWLESRLLRWRAPVQVGQDRPMPS
ncbi:MAG TPA: ABC transporter permease [Burkholderiales bacterium]